MSSQDRESKRRVRRALYLLSAVACFPFITATITGQAPGTVEEWLPAQAALSRQIQGGSSEQKRDALLTIRNLRNARASALAVPALGDGDAIVRATATASVVFLPPAEASTALLPLLSDKSEFVRREAAYALGEVRDPRAVAQLVRLMQSDKIFEVRTAATISLGKIGDASALESLAAILKKRPTEDEEFLRRSAARSIGQIAQVLTTGKPDVLTPQNFLPEKFKELDPITPSLPPLFSSSEEVLVNSLQSKRESDDTRREAAFALGAIGSEKAVRALQTFSFGEDPYLAEICKEALAKIERRNRPVKLGV